jgi:hypothetical protein
MTGQDLNAFFLQEVARAATRVGVQPTFRTTPKVFE